MVINAAEIVRKIGIGVSAAFETCEFFLGVEELSTRNADIHPEYVTTVMVGRELTGVDHWVILEARMKDLRRDALGIARLRTLKSSKTSWPAIRLAVSKAQYLFGKQRLDILVHQAGRGRPPLLLVEAKLGVGNIGGVINDINRIVRLFDLYDDVGALDRDQMYGAVVFHVMQETGTAATLPPQAAALLGEVERHLATLQRTKPKLRFNAGLLTNTLKIAETSGYEEPRYDGSVERVFEKHGYAFQAGLILVGNADDVVTVTF